MSSPNLPPLIENIPDPQAIRRRLAEVLREASLLRSLLRIAERKARAGDTVSSFGASHRGR